MKRTNNPLMQYTLHRFFFFSVILLAEPLFSQQARLLVALNEVLTIGDTAGQTFSQVGDVAVDGEGNIFVTDRYQCKVMKYSPRGEFLAEYGKSGKGKMEFQSGPAKIDLCDTLVAVSDLSTARIVLLTNELRPLGELNAVGPIVDIVGCRIDRMYCSVLPLSGDASEILGLYSRTAGMIASIPLVNPPPQLTLQLVLLCVDRMDNLIAAYALLNRIMLYDSRGKPISSFRIDGLPEFVPTDTLSSDKFGILPKGELIKGVAVHPESLIFVLSGDFSDHPSRDLYVLDYHGKLLQTYTLPRETGLLYIDAKGFLYTREHNRTLVKKYRIQLSGHHKQKETK
ncbi:MAG TPA: hypothetical protein VGR15_01055 [Bacteroidota bacterium]|jgi:hypothetical protein|nr:hypothetical protein [Bacteroidota bacterium]